MSTIPDQNLMTISATDLRGKSPEIGFLKGEIRRHIKLIEGEIRDAQKAKQTEIQHGIEQNFAVTKCPNRTAQRFVYAGIIDQLNTNGFETQLILNKKNCYFRITWITEMDRNEIARQEELIRRATSANYAQYAMKPPREDDDEI